MSEQVNKPTDPGIELAHTIKSLPGNHPVEEVFEWFLNASIHIAIHHDKKDIPEDVYGVPDMALGTAMDLVELYCDLVSRAEPFTDILGPAYHALIGASGARAPYLTPSMAAIAAEWLLRERRGADGQLLTAIDTGCMSGALLMACMRELIDTRGTMSLVDWSFIGVDRSPTQAKITATQLFNNYLEFKYRPGEIIIAYGDPETPDTLQTLAYSRAQEVHAAMLLANHPEDLKRQIRETAGADQCFTHESIEESVDQEMSTHGEIHAVQ